MTSRQQELVREILDEALSRPPQEWRLLVESRAGDDAIVKCEVESLLATRKLAADDSDTRSMARAPERSQPAGRADSPEGRFLPGDVFAGRYRIVSLLGRGGMGEVYRAHDLQLEETIALKFLTSANIDANKLERFRNEVRTARQVTHANVCRVFDIGESAGAVYLTMEYIDGEDLGSLLRRIGRLPEETGVAIAHQLCAGLAAAHEKGILHRDLKPGNIMIDGRGNVHITDFGLAAWTELVEGREAANGTPLYMAPEQLSGERASLQSDIYALGLVLYETFSGRRPFEAPSVAELYKLRKFTSVPRASTVTNLDPAIDRVIARCLDADPKQRPATARSLLAAFPGMDPLAAALAAGETPSPELVAEAGGAGTLSRTAAFALLAIIVAGLVGVPVLFYRTGWQSRLELDQSPDVLAHHARELTGEFGYAGIPRDVVYGFGDLPDGTPIFWFRQAPCILQADTMTNGMLPPGRVDQNNPLDPCPDAITMELDTRGRLVSWNSKPPDGPPDPDPVASPWQKLIEAAGLDATRFKEIAATFTPRNRFDRKTAWQGTPHDNAPEIQVEAAFWGAKPVYFSVAETSRVPTTRHATPRAASLGVLLGLGLVAVVGGAMLAWRNLRAGRIDRRAAFRIAAVEFCLCLYAWTFYCTHRATFFEVTVFVYAVGWSMVMAGLVWLLYVGLDPFIRRRWPHAIISLSRVVDGRIRDPLVARDILIGIAASLVYGVLTVLELQANGMRARTAFDGASAFGGAGVVAGHLAYDAEVTVWITLVIFCLVFLFRLALRRSWLVAAVLISIFAIVGALNGHGSAVTAILVAADFGIQFFVLLQFGLFPFMVLSFLGPVWRELAYSPDLSKWYALPSFVILALTMATAVWAFRRTLPDRKLISDQFLYQ